MAIIDEASEVSEEAITMIQGRLSGSLEIPTNYEELPQNLKTYVDKSLHVRQTWMACNPKSEQHYLYKTFVRESKPGHRIFISNSIANTNLPVNYLVQNLAAYVRDGKDLEWIKEQIRKIRNGEEDPSGLHLKEHLTPLGCRNLLGLWIALEGAIYNLDESRHLLSSKPSHWLTTGLYYVGVDFGFHNPRVAVLEKCKLTVGDSIKTGYAAVDYWHGKEATADDLMEALGKFKVKYSIDKIILPHDRPDIFKKARSAFGASFLKKAKTSVLPGILTTSEFINSTRLIFIKTTEDLDKPDNHALVWQEMTGYEWKKDKDGNFLDEPVKKDDHYCLAFGTKVITEFGSKSIEDIKLGEKLLTHSGEFYPVEMIATTPPKRMVKIETKNSYLLASEDHPIYTREGMKPAGLITERDEICLTTKKYTTGGYLIEGTQIQTTTQIEYTTVALTILREILSICIVKSLSTILAPFQMGTKFTIRMKTPQTILPKIWKYLQSLTTLKDTIGKETSKDLQKPGKPQRNGINPKRVWNGIESMVKGYGKPYLINQKLKTYVSLAVMNLRYTLLKGVDLTIATQTVKLSTYERVERVSYQRESQCIEIGVTKDHTYYANGILVGNCDAVRYAVHTLEYRGQSDE
jgi:hypothetical protein